MALLIGVPKETAAGEKRVATVPEVVEKLIKLGFQVAVESGAGDAAKSSANDEDLCAGNRVGCGSRSRYGSADGAGVSLRGERRCGGECENER